tara:strand:- start:149 stop:826 length:678 start_codon:yes stop_codon:yes gene_type:complete
MGYLDKTSVTVDAILTKRGRELLGKGDFKITQFAVADDEIPYTLFNEDHPNGSQYSGEAIENMALLEAIPDGNNIMLHKLVTLPRGTSAMPILTLNMSKIVLSLNSSITINPETLNLTGLRNNKETSYSARIADRRLLKSFRGTGRGRVANTSLYSNSPLSETVTGTSFSLTSLSGISLFGTNTKLITTITVTGNDSGASITIPVEISKEIQATTYIQGQTGVVI